jgi:hypothetical protein
VIDVDALLAEAHENIPRSLGDWANLATRLRDALEQERSDSQEKA